jgi:hypothetical protein
MRTLARGDRTCSQMQSHHIRLKDVSFCPARFHAGNLPLSFASVMTRFPFRFSVLPGRRSERVDVHYYELRLEACTSPKLDKSPLPYLRIVSRSDYILYFDLPCTVLCILLLGSHIDAVRRSWKNALQSSTSLTSETGQVPSILSYCWLI